VGVIAILFMIWLLVPAVPRGHVVASLTQCQNNLKQITLGVHNYASAYGNNLPPLTSDMKRPQPGLPAYNGGIFLTLLPFVEQYVVFDSAVRYLPDCTWYAPIPPATTLPLSVNPPLDPVLSSQPLIVFQCPSDSTIVKRQADSTIFKGLSTNQTQTRTDRAPYCFPWAASSYTANYQVFGTENRFGAPDWGNYCGPKYNIGNVPDGLSNTAFFGEQFAACGTTAGNLWAYPGIGSYSGPEYSAVPGAQVPVGAGDSIVNTPESSNSPLWFPVFANGDPTYGFTSGGVGGSIFRHDNQKPAPSPIVLPYDAGLYWDAPPQTGIRREDCDKSRLQSFHKGGVVVGMGDGSVRLINGQVSQHSWYCAIVPDDGTPFDGTW
jgi:hypothetical protein